MYSRNMKGGRAWQRSSLRSQDCTGASRLGERAVSERAYKRAPSLAVERRYFGRLARVVEDTLGVSGHLLKT